MYQENQLLTIFMWKTLFIVNNLKSETPLIGDHKLLMFEIRSKRGAPSIYSQTFSDLRGGNLSTGWLEGVVQFAVNNQLCLSIIKKNNLSLPIIPLVENFTNDVVPVHFIQRCPWFTLHLGRIFSASFEYFW